MMNMKTSCRRTIDTEAAAQTHPLELFMEPAKTVIGQRFDALRDLDILRKHYKVLDRYVETNSGV